MSNFTCRVNGCDNSYDTARGRKQHESRSHDEPTEDYEREDILRELYWGENLSQNKIAERLGCSSNVVNINMKKHGIETRNRGENRRDAPHTNAHILEQKYHQEGKSAYEIGDELDVSAHTIITWMEKHGIERRSREEACSRVGARYAHDSNGYPYWSVWDKNNKQYTMVRVHKLLVIANGYKAKDVFNPSMNVHHKNGIKWDNRPKNLELLSKSEHQKLHMDINHRGGEYDVV